MSPVTVLSVVFPVKVRALSGHVCTHSGAPLQVSQIIALCVIGCSVTAPYSQASMHQPQPLHLFSSTVTVPVSVDWINASLGQATTQGAFLQVRHVIAAFRIWLSLTVRIRDFEGLKTFSFSMEQASSQMSQPIHFSESQLTNWLAEFRA